MVSGVKLIACDQSYLVAIFFLADSVSDIFRWMSPARPAGRSSILSYQVLPKPAKALLGARQQSKHLRVLHRRGRPADTMWNTRLSTADLFLGMLFANRLLIQSMVHIAPRRILEE